MRSITGQPRPSRPPAPSPHPATAGAFFVGSVLAMSFLSSDWGHTLWAGIRLALVGAACTAIWIGAGWRGDVSPIRRWMGRACATALVGLYVLWGYLASSFGVLLGWAVPFWLRLLVAALAVLTVATLFRERGRFRLPVILPLGVWIAAVLFGWLREETRVRCDDFFSLQAPVQLVVANPQVDNCHRGEVRPSGRFPRTIWQAPDRERIFFTTQGEAAPGGFDGAACEARLDGQVPARCVGRPYNKSQGLIEIPELERVLVFQWGIRTPSGEIGAAILELPRQGELEIIAEHWFDELLGDGFYEPRNATLYMVSDRLNGLHRATLPSFELQPTAQLGVPTAGELRYDPAIGEGVLCGAGIGAAVRGAPLSARRFRDANWSPIDKLSVSWGCDWDAVARKVYSTVPNLGLLVRIDYDSGRVEDRWFVGLGRRSVAYDRARRRVYFTDFLRGQVLAFDEASEKIIDRWFVGHFSRWVQLTRDGDALLATSNLGVVRIPLDAKPEEN